MRRIVVAGARGFFGSHVLALICSRCAAVAASRRPGSGIRLDVEDRASIRSALRPGDILVDATGPFQTRTTTLVEEAIAIGFDVVDLCDSLGFARKVALLDDAARRRGVSVLNACSAVSVVSALAVGRSEISAPEYLRGFLAPATRHTVNRGVLESFLWSVGKPIQVWRGGTWRDARGCSESREFAALGRRGYLIESADSLLVPRVVPTLRDVDFWIDPNLHGVAPLLAVARRVPIATPVLSALLPFTTPLAKLAGRGAGILAYEIGRSAARGSNATATVVFRGPDSFQIAAIPAALAAIRLAEGYGPGPGVVPVNQQVPDNLLLDTLERYAITVHLAGREASRVQ